MVSLALTSFEVETDIFHAIVFIFRITIAIGTIAVMLFESYHMKISFTDFLPFLAIILLNFIMTGSLVGIPFLACSRSHFI